MNPNTDCIGVMRMLQRKYGAISSKTNHLTKKKKQNTMNKIRFKYNDLHEDLYTKGLRFGEEP